MGLVEEQFDALAARPRFADAKLTPSQNGTYLVTIPHFSLPPGWNKAETTVYFQIPVGYPTARPDTFWTDFDLGLASNAKPMNTGENNNHGLNVPLLWFSWHPSTWNPNRDTLITYVGLIRKRLEDPR